MTRDEALLMAIEAIENADYHNDLQAIAVIKDIMAQPKPEYLAFMDTPQRTWVGLTDEEIDKGLVRTNYAMQTAGAWRDGVEWAIKQLKEKNT